jgi:hypothetical protein
MESIVRFPQKMAQESGSIMQQQVAMGQTYKRIGNKRLVREKIY